MNELILQAERQGRSLLARRDAELADLFATLDAGALPAGYLHGRVFAVTGLGWLPRPLASGLYRLLGTPANPWRGKSFLGESGSNQWGRLGGLRFGHYDIGRQIGPDGKPSLWLDYSLPENPGWLRGVRGEAREMQPGLWLCRMLWESNGKPTTLLWFTLTGNPSTGGGDAR